jgi:acetylornithine deacetylase
MSTEKRQKLLAEVDARREQAIEFLRKIISIPSVTGDEGPIQQFMADYMHKLGLEVDVWESDWEQLKQAPGYIPVHAGYENRPNIVAILKGTGGGRSLLLNGHTDVIPPGPREAWTDDPFSATLRDGRIYGRGASDMKGGVAAQVMAVECLQAVGFAPKGDILLNFVIDEELSGHGTLDTVLRGYTADAGISGETSGLAIQPACLGRIWWEILIKGKPAGIQRRYQGVNAIELGYKIVQAVADLEKQRIETCSHPLYPSNLNAIPCMVGSFEAGSFPSAFPDTCLLKGSIAALPGEDHEAVKQSLVDQVARAAAEDPWMKDHAPQVRFVGYDGKASEIPRDHDIVTTLSKCFTEITGREPEISGREGAADTRFLNGIGNTPTVIFGPGPTEQMHANDEWVPVDDYITAIKIIALCIVDWCGAE